MLDQAATMLLMDSVQQMLEADFARLRLLAAVAGVPLPASTPDAAGGVWAHDGGHTDASVTWAWVCRNLDLPGSAVWWLTHGDVDRARLLVNDEDQLRTLRDRQSKMTAATGVLTRKMNDAPSAWLRRAWSRELAEREDDAHLFHSALLYLTELQAPA